MKASFIRRPDVRWGVKGVTLLLSCGTYLLLSSPVFLGLVESPLCGERSTDLRTTHTSSEGVLPDSMRALKGILNIWFRKFSLMSAVEKPIWPQNSTLRTLLFMSPYCLENHPSKAHGLYRCDSDHCGTEFKYTNLSEIPKVCSCPAHRI